MTNSKVQYIKTISSPIGFLTVTADDNAITSLTMSDKTPLDSDIHNPILEEEEALIY